MELAGWPDSVRMLGGLGGELGVADVIQLDSAREPSLRAAETAAPTPHLRMDVHDRSRVEWVATVPVAPAGQTHTWQVDFEAEFTDQMWVPHQPWEHFQVRTRLTSPVLAPGHRMVGPPIDQLRRRALAATHELKLSARGPMHVLLTARRRDRILREDEATEVVRRLEAALAKAKAARDACDYLRDVRDPALQREQLLVDEWVSHHVLLLITRITTALQGVATRRRPARPLRGDIGRVHAALKQAFATEQAHLRDSGLGTCMARGRHDVEAFVNRGALLKKHFQQALFLDARAYMLDARMRNWIAVVMAMVASTFYFVWQIYVLNAAMTAGTTTISLVMAGLIAALVYAAKDRIKEVGRDWVARRLKHGYADRVAHLSLQQRMDPHRTRLALARETIHVRRRVEPDRLNPGLGRTTVMHQSHVRELLRHTGVKLLHEQGLTGMKHIFRYDLSPLFDKLDDHLKRIPVDTPEGMRTMSATRVYSIPVRVRLRQLGVEQPFEMVERGVVLVRRRGLERFVRGSDAVELAREQGMTVPDKTPLPVPGVAAMTAKAAS
jgi:hypothetical protein